MHVAGTGPFHGMVEVCKGVSLPQTPPQAETKNPLPFWLFLYHPPHLGQALQRCGSASSFSQAEGETP